jgi:hypothetical protein
MKKPRIVFLAAVVLGLALGGAIALVLRERAARREMQRISRSNGHQDEERLIGTVEELRTT